MLRDQDFPILLEVQLRASRGSANASSRIAAAPRRSRGHPASVTPGDLIDDFGRVHIA